MRILAATLFSFGVAAAAGPSPEEQAIAYLAREVPRWSKQNHCFSCHNNGDGARALYVARRRGYPVPAAALADTTAWLKRPRQWDQNRGDPRFSDKKLARIQFAASLAEAVAGRSLIEAAESLLPYQQADGSWQVDAEANVGSPVTWGTALATAMTRRTLQKAGAPRFRAAIARADRWLLAAPATTILDAAAVVLALGDHRPECVELLVRGQTSDGGWGPHLHSPPEAFDTSVVLLALSSLAWPELRPVIERGRAYLLQAQLESGGWPETTRPPGGQSYAQHISTSGWATLALLMSRK